MRGKSPKQKHMAVITIRYWGSDVHVFMNETYEELFLQQPFIDRMSSYSGLSKPVGWVGKSVRINSLYDYGEVVKWIRKQLPGHKFQISFRAWVRRLVSGLVDT